MDRVSPLPSQGAVFFDVRDEARSLRLSFHPELGVFVLSLWRGSECLGSFRLAADETPRLIHSLVSPLAQSHRALRGEASEAG